MKLTFLFLLLSLMQLSASVYSQSTKLSLDFQGTKISDILMEIENTTDCRFFYQREQVDVDRIVDLKVTEESVGEILDKLFQEQGISYKIMDDNLILLTTNKEQAGTQQTTGNIKGLVTDKTNQPLPGVTVVIKGTSNGTLTDPNGEYHLKNVPSDAVLVFSFIGMKTSEKEIAGQAVLDVTLEEETVGIEEVVAVGYGVQKKVNLTGAVASLSGEELKSRPITQASQSLQGVSGLYVNQAGAQPGFDGTTIRIRGIGTLNSNDPLVLVDGVEYPLDALNPSDIESISVLKDAASASIYGNRAANGVILVTTKKGKSNEKTSIEYGNYFGFQRTIGMPDLITDPVEFMELRNQAQINAGKTSVDYSDDLIEEYKAGRLTDPYTYPNNNWLDIMFDDAPIQNHDLRFSGGSEKATYSLSMGYQDQDGVLMSSGSHRFTLNSNISIQANNWLKVGANVTGIRQYIQAPTAGVYNVMQMTFKAQGFHPTYLEDGRYANTFIKTPGHNVYRHPIVLAKEGHRDREQQRALVSMFAEIKLPANLTYYAKLGVNSYNYFYSEFVPEIEYYQVKTLEASTVDFYTSNRNRHLTTEDDRELNTTLFHTLTWDQTFNDKHKLKLLVGSSYEKFTSGYHIATIEGFLGNDLTELDAGSTNKDVSGDSSANALVGFFGRLNYDFDQKFLFEANLRYDGSSRFADGNRWGWFPSFSTGYRLEQENFMADLPWVSLMKVRASYGSLGNQEIGNFRYINLIDTGIEYSFGGSTNAGAAVTAYNDPSITWETTTISNLGLDAGLFQNKVNFSVEWYKKRTKNILRSVTLASQVGDLTGPVQNIGAVDNTGLEITVGHRNHIGKFSYEVQGSINFNKNKVVDLNDDEIISGKYITKEGYAIDSYYILEADGIFQSQDEIDNSAYQNSTTKPGYLKYVDQNNDGTIDDDDRIIAGDAQPDFTYSFNINLQYRNFALTTFFQGVQGIDTYPQGIVATPFWYGTSVTREWVNNSWTEDRPNAKLPIMTTYELSSSDNFRNSNFWLKDASYLRLKNIQLSYSIPKSILSRVNAKDLTIFVNGQNLLTFSKMKDFDPEKPITSDHYYSYPSVKTFTAGFNLKF
ncbi:TonB-dependent receptor [Mangrovibacterium diazotrophicum]|nr:TonB-dependent receptor [Mangrovibacterium diazotrophicum]